MPTESFPARIVGKIRRVFRARALSWRVEAFTDRRFTDLTGTRREPTDVAIETARRDVPARRPPDMSGRSGLMMTQSGPTGRPRVVPSGTGGVDRFLAWALHRVGDADAGQDGFLQASCPFTGVPAAVAGAGRAVLAGCGTAGSVAHPAPARRHIQRAGPSWRRADRIVPAVDGTTGRRIRDTGRRPVRRE